ncbi:MAG: hypothetical protein QW339_00665 [Sulfolobales archaeon]
MSNHLGWSCIQLYGGRKYRSLKQRVEAVEVLIAYKEVFSYKELSKRLGIHTSMLCRYAQGLTVPNDENVRKVLNILLSKEAVRELIYRSLSKYGWELSKVLSNHKVLNVLGLYVSNRVLSSLVGSGLKLLISLPGTPALIASLTAIRLGLPVALIPHTTTKHSTDVFSIFDEVSLCKGDYVAVITDVLTTENLNIVREFLDRHELILKCLISVVLVDKEVEKEVSSLTLFDYLIP